MIYEDKTGLIRRGLFDVQNEVGLGRKEEVFHQAFHSWLEEQTIPHFSKKAHPLLLYGEVAHVLCPDFVVWDCISIEMKAVSRHLRDEERVQIFNYLKRREDKLGLLVNMGLDRVHVERIVYDRPCYEVVFTALFDDNNFNIQRCRSFMKALGLNWGIAINFGKRKLEINGLSHRTG